MTRRVPLAAIAAVLLLAVPAARADDSAPADLYNRRCSTCHGKDGKAKRMGSSDISETKASAAELEKVITDGKGKMASFKARLTPEQVKAVAAYVKGGFKS